LQIAVLTFTLGVACATIYGVTQLEPAFDETLFVRGDSYLRSFLDEREKYYKTEGMAGAVFLVGNGVNCIHLPSTLVKCS